MINEERDMIIELEDDDEDGITIDNFYADDSVKEVFDKLTLHELFNKKIFKADGESIAALVYLKTKLDDSLINILDNYDNDSEAMFVTLSFLLGIKTNINHAKDKICELLDNKKCISNLLPIIFEDEDTTKYVMNHIADLMKKKNID